MEPIYVVSIDLTAHLVLVVVSNIVPVSEPPHLVRIRLFLRIKQRLHTIVKKRVRFHEID